MSAGRRCMIEHPACPWICCLPSPVWQLMSQCSHIELVTCSPSQSFYPLQCSPSPVSNPHPVSAFACSTTVILLPHPSLPSSSFNLIYSSPPTPSFFILLTLLILFYHLFSPPTPTPIFPSSLPWLVILRPPHPPSSRQIFSICCVLALPLLNSRNPHHGSVPCTVGTLIFDER